MQHVCLIRTKSRVETTLYCCFTWSSGLFLGQLSNLIVSTRPQEVTVPGQVVQHVTLYKTSYNVFILEVLVGRFVTFCKSKAIRFPDFSLCAKLISQNVKLFL